MNDLTDFFEDEAVPRNQLLDKYFLINNEYMPVVEEYEIDYIEDDDNISIKYPSIFGEDEKIIKTEKLKNFSLTGYLFRIINKDMTINDIRKVTLII